MRLRFLGVISAFQNHRNSNMYDCQLHTAERTELILQHNLSYMTSKTYFDCSDTTRSS